MIYKETIAAKTGGLIPLFCDGRPMHSKYNPLNESLSVPQDCTGGCFIVAGIGAGFHLTSLAQRFPRSCIIAFEADTESLGFCKQFPAVRQLLSSHHIHLCTVESLPEMILSNYVPAIYGDLFFLTQRAWESENPKLCAQAQQLVSESMKSVSADYSVQSHFGKVWMRNILLNLREFKGNPSVHYSSGKTAAVIAAGPSLDASVKALHDRRDSFFIFATDTTYGSLLQQQIIPDVVVSVDGQHISTTHFFPCPPCTAQGTQTLFVFDICTNAENVKLVTERGYRTFFVHSMHPLAQLVSRHINLPHLETGAGTVTIACCDFARLLGFKDIALFGADFAYSSGKPYAKGTYLEPQFFGHASRTVPAETAFSALMYRTPLEHQHGDSVFSGPLVHAKTSSVLKRYEETLLAWAKSHRYEVKDGMLRRHADGETFLTGADERRTFSYHAFLNGWLEAMKDFSPETDFTDDENFYALLPYIAYLRSIKNVGKQSLFELFKLAYSHASRYN